MKKFAAILRDIGFVFFSVFILFMIFLMSSGKHISIAGYQVLRVLTSSMEPTISENTCIIIKKVPVENLKVGDVITFTSDDPQIQGLYNTHRIHDIVEEKGETLYVTKGDAIDAVDAYPVHQNQVAGIYVRELPGGRLLGKCFVALSDNRIYFLVIILPLMLCLLSYFWQIMGMFRKPDEELVKEEDAQEEISREKNIRKPSEEAFRKETVAELSEEISGEEYSGKSAEGASEKHTDVITAEMLEALGLSEEELTKEAEKELLERLRAAMAAQAAETGKGSESNVRNQISEQAETSEKAEVESQKESQTYFSYPEKNFEEIKSDEEDYRYTEEDYQDEDYRYDFTKDNI